jgi:PAS domain S-box-containing protein
MIDPAGGHRAATARHEPVLPRIVEGIGESSGREFFRRLCEQLALGFDASAVRLSELSSDGKHASALGAYSRLDFALASDFSTDGTIAEGVAGGEMVVREAHVRSAFPDDAALSRMFAEGYIGVPMKDVQGDVVGMVELFSDRPFAGAERACYVVRAMAGRAVAEIERDQAETALRDSEMRYRALIEDSFHLVAEVVDERYIYVSPGYTDALGHEPEDLLGGSMFDLVHPEDRQRVASELKPIAATREAARFTARLRHNDGSWRWVESTARVFRTAEGEFRTTIFSRDITERLVAEQGLRESEERFRLLAEHSTDIIGRYTKDLLCTWISPSIKTITGWEPEEVVGTLVRDRIHPDDQVPPEERASILPGPGSPRTHVVRYLHKDGHYIWLETHTSAVMDPQRGKSSKSTTARATSPRASSRRTSCVRARRSTGCSPRTRTI